MKIEAPSPAQIPQLRALWQEAFGDSDAALDTFFGTAFSPRRCRCITLDGTVAAALYWFTVSCGGQKMAYLYAVATAAAYRGRGLCRELMAQTQRVLTQEGYCAALLVPEGAGLARMYRSMGYETATEVRQFSCTSADAPVPLRRIHGTEYARLRRDLLPPGGVMQEGESLAFLEAQAELYAGSGWIAAVQREDTALLVPELLGDSSAAPGILTALGVERGTFRTPGKGKPLAMWLPLTREAPVPTYFGLAFDEMAFT